MEYDLIYKIIFIGDSGVGKSQIVQSITNDTHHQTSSTIGVEFIVKYMKILNDLTVKIQIWDTAGQERYKSLVPSYSRNANCIIYVYDTTDKSSFDNILYWINEVNIIADNYLGILIGNKIDKEYLRQVPTNMGKEFAEKNNLLFFEISALNNNNTILIFNNIIIATHYKFIDKNDIITNINNTKINLNKSSIEKNTKCKC